MVAYIPCFCISSKALLYVFYNQSWPSEINLPFHPSTMMKIAVPQEKMSLIDDIIKKLADCENEYFAVLNSTDKDVPLAATLDPQLQDQAGLLIKPQVTEDHMDVDQPECRPQIVSVDAVTRPPSSSGSSSSNQKPMQFKISFNRSTKELSPKKSTVRKPIEPIDAPDLKKSTEDLADDQTEPSRIDSRKSLDIDTTDGELSGN